MNRYVVLVILLLSSSVCAEDFREEFARQMETLGQELQKTQDEQGVCAAHQKLTERVQFALPILVQRIKGSIDLLSEKEAEATIFEIQKNHAFESEEVALFLSDRSLTDKEKIKTLYEKSLENKNDYDLEMLEAEALKMGYQKVFKDLAQEVRSRGYGYTGPNPNWRAILLFSSVILVIAVVPPPVSAYLATGILFITAYLEVRDFYQRQADEDPIYFSPPRRDPTRGDPNRKVIPYP